MTTSTPTRPVRATGPARLVLDLLRALALTAVLGLAAGATWWLWMGWDEPDFSAWQVAGCVLMLLAVAGVGYGLVNPILVGAAMTVGFTLGFATNVMPRDDSGLALVGVMVVFTAMLLASLVVGTVVYLAGVRPRAGARRRSARTARADGLASGA